MHAKHCGSFGRRRCRIGRRHNGGRVGPRRVWFGKYVQAVKETAGECATLFHPGVLARDGPVDNRICGTLGLSHIGGFCVLFGHNDTPCFGPLGLFYYFRQIIPKNISLST